MPNTITLRPATPSDADLVARLHTASWHASYRGILPDAYLDRDMPAEMKAAWRAKFAELAPSELFVAIAELDGEAFGFVCARRDAEADVRFGVLVDNLHVLGHHQGTGAGKRLLHAAQQWAAEHGASQLYLHVLARNVRAIAFYERQGWRFSGSEQHVLGGTPVEARRYVRPLPVDGSAGDACGH